MLQKIKSIDVWLLLALVGLIFPRVGNLNPFLGFFKANNFIDILVGVPDVAVLLLVGYELLRQGWRYRLLVVGLFVLGYLQVYFNNPSWIELADNWLFTLRLSLFVVVILEVVKATSSGILSFLQTSSGPSGHLPQGRSEYFWLLLALIVPYTLLDHLLLSNSVAVLMVWVVVNFLGLYDFSSAKISSGPSGHLPQGGRIFITLLVFFLSLNAFVAVWQVFSGDSLGLHFLGESYLDDAQPGVAKQVIGAYQLTFLRGYGLMAHPNVLGFVGVMGAWFGLVIASGRLRRLMFSLGVLLAILSFSRLAWLGLLILGLYFVLEKKQFKWVAVKNLLKKFWWAIGGGFGFFIYVFLTRFSKEGSDYTRLQEYQTYWSAYGELGWSQKLFGLGLGQYPFYLRTLHPEWDWWLWQPIHNLWLLVFFELGIVWSALLVTSFIYWTWSRFKSRFSYKKS